MSQILTDARTVFLHDLDGVHYPYNIFDDIMDFCGNVKGEVVPHYLPHLSAAEAKAMGKESYLTTGDGLRLFVETGKKLGMDEILLRNTLDIEYHKMQLVRVQELMPAVLTPCEDTVALFNELRGHICHGMISQCNMKEWGHPLLEQKKLLEYFVQGSTFGFAEFDFKLKSREDEALRRILKFLGAKPEEAAFLEDSKDNLKRAKQFSEKLLTVFFHHGQPLAQLPDYIDMQTQNLRTFFADVARLQLAPKIRRPSFYAPQNGVEWHI